MIQFNKLKTELTNMVKARSEDFLAQNGYKDLTQISRDKTCAISKLSIKDGNIVRLDLFPVSQVRKTLNSLKDHRFEEIGETIEMSLKNGTFFKDPEKERVLNQITEDRIKRAFENIIDCVSVNYENKQALYSIERVPLSQRKLSSRSSGPITLDNSRKLSNLKDLAKQFGYL